MNITGTITGQIVINSQPVTPPPGRYYLVLRDYETNEWGGGVRESVVKNHGEPATIKTMDDRWIPMPKAFQEWFWEVWNSFAPAGMSDALRKQKWAGYWHSNLAWTNYGHGSDLCADYINGTNLDKEPMARETLWSRGNIVKLQDGFTDFGGQKWWPMDAITNDVTKLPSPEEFRQMWWLCGFATVQTDVKFDDGTYQVDRFPHLKDPVTGLTNDVPMPPLSKDGVLFFDKNRLREVEPGIHYNPYNPPRPFSP